MVALLLAVALAAFAYADQGIGLDTLGRRESVALIGITLVLVALVIATGMFRARSLRRHVDIFHPLVFPLAYVSFACIAPVAAMWIDVGGQFSHLGIGSFYSLSRATPALLCLFVIGFAAGASFDNRPPKRPAPVPLLSKNARPVAPSRLHMLGRAFVIPGIAFYLYEVLTGRVISRGADQNVITITDSLTVFANSLLLSGVVLLAAARHRAPGRGALSRTDWILVSSAVVFLGATGSRSTVLAIVIVLLSFVSGERFTGIRALAGAAFLSLFAYVVVSFRTRAVTGQYDTGILASNLTDLSSVAITTGLSNKLPPQHGSTLWAAIYRQLPGPLVNHLFGQPQDTGAFVFRRLTGLTASNQGYGFSLPAEGVINWGAPGTVAVGFALGLLLSVMYRHYQARSVRFGSLAYVVMVASLPYALRCDFLAAIKGVLYPVVLVLVALKLSRGASTHRTKNLSGGSSTHRTKIRMGGQRGRETTSCDASGSTRSSRAAVASDASYGFGERRAAPSSVALRCEGD